MALAICVPAVVPAKAAPQDLRHIKTVAVISVLGGTFLFERVTDKPFEWLGPPESHFLEISDWGLDARITREVSDALKPRFAVKPVSFDPADFSTWDNGLLKRSTLDLNCDPGIDAFVFILRDWRSDPIGHSVHEIGGLGLYRRDGRKPRYGVFASYRVVLVDALTGDVIESRAGLNGKRKLPWLSVPSSFWPKTPNDLTDAERSSFVSDEQALVDTTLMPTLRKMALAN